MTGDQQPNPPRLPAGVDLADRRWWDEPAPVESLMAEIGAAPRRRWPRRLATGLVAAAAVVAALAAGYTWGRPGVEPPRGVEVILAAAGPQPNAAASARVDETPNGTWIRLDVTALAPAPDGTYYEAWLTGPDGAVSAGTFHMRGEPGPVVLWAGVSPADFPDLVVSLQHEVVLEGTLGG